jgi:hypothetical protein
VARDRRTDHDVGADIDEHVGVWTLLGIPEDDVLEAAEFAMAHRAARA